MRLPTLLAAGLVLAACAAPTVEPEQSVTFAPRVSESGLELCDLSSLPEEAQETAELIEGGGPFPYPGKDGSVFGNFEGILPPQERGYYHEYTVPTPGRNNRGAQRIVTGGMPLTDPPDAFYTDDHYETFCEIEGL